MKLTLLLLLSSLFAGLKGQSGSGESIESLFAKSEVILSGRIDRDIFSMTGDLGTEVHNVQLQRDSIYKIDRLAFSESISFVATFSNLDFPTLTTDPLGWWAPYGKGKWLFFLAEGHLNGEAAEMPPTRMVRWTPEIGHRLRELAEANRIDLRPEPKQKAAPCAFCRAAEAGDWAKVERIVKGYVRRWNHARKLVPSLAFWLKEKSCVTEVVPPMAVLASLPTWGSDYVRLNLHGQEVIIYISYQLGRIDYFLRIYWGESLDYMKVTKIGFADDPVPGLAKVHKGNVVRTLTDTLAANNYPPPYIPPDIVFYQIEKTEGFHYYFLNCISLTPKHWQETLDKLVAEKHVFNLCLATMHCHQDVRIKAVRYLREIGDPNVLPYLMELALYSAQLAVPGSEEATLYGVFCEELILTLDALTHSKVGIGMGYHDPQGRLAMGLEVWKRKVVY